MSTFKFTTKYQLPSIENSAEHVDLKTEHSEIILMMKYAAELSVTIRDGRFITLTTTLLFFQDMCNF